jgi:plasmid stabilization system protein ParE
VNWPPFYPPASREFDEAFDFLASESPAAARRFVDRTKAT